MYALNRHRTAAAPAMALTEMLGATALRHATHPAVIYGDQMLTYGELADRSERLMNWLAALGVRPGDRVALVAANSPEFVLSFFAVTALGAVIVPLNPGYRKDELAHYFG